MARFVIVAAACMLAACGDSPSEPQRGDPVVEYVVVNQNTGQIAVGWSHVEGLSALQGQETGITTFAPLAGGGTSIILRSPNSSRVVGEVLEYIYSGGATAYRIHADHFDADGDGVRYDCQSPSWQCAKVDLP